MGCVSGLLKEHGGILSFSELLIKLGGAESEGEYRIELNQLFRVVDASEKKCNILVVKLWLTLN